MEMKTKIIIASIATIIIIATVVILNLSCKPSIPTSMNMPIASSEITVTPANSVETITDTTATATQVVTSPNTNVTNIVIAPAQDMNDCAKLKIYCAKCNF